MSLRVTFFSFLVLLTTLSFGQRPKYIDNITGAGYQYSRDVAVDNFGNHYTLGVFDGVITVRGTVTLTSSGALDYFLVKYDSLGNVVWARSAGGPGDDSGEKVVIDGYGNVYVTGYFSGSMTVGNYTMTGYGGVDIFIVKYTPDGLLDWAQYAGGASDDASVSIAKDRYENVYITGRFAGTANFGKAPSIVQLISSGGNDAFTAKYDPFGILQWVRGDGFGGNDWGQDLKVGTDDILYIGINISDGQQVYFNKISIIDGNFISTITKDFWANIVEPLHEMALDNNNNIYYVGNYIKREIGFPRPAYNSDNSYGYMVKISNVGVDYFANTVGYPKWDNGYYYDYVYGIDVDRDAHIYIVGEFTYDLRYLTIYSVTSYNDTRDGILMKFNTNGNFMYSQTFWGDNSQVVRDIALDSKNNIYVAGDLAGRVNIGRLLIDCNGWDVFNVKFSPEKPIDVLYPENGEKLRIGDTYALRYDNYNSYQVDQYVSVDNGISWTALGRINFYGGINTFNWTVASQPTKTAKITIVQHDNVGIRDESKKVFTIARLDFTSPQNQANLLVTQDNRISWNSTNIDRLKIEYSTDNGINWTLVADTVTAQLGYFDWKIPNYISMQAKIRLSDADYPDVKTTQNVRFLPYLRLDNPVPNAICRIGTTQEIKWTSISSRKINIFYTTNGGSSWIGIDTNISSSLGRYIWKVPQTPSDNCYIMLQDFDYPIVFVNNGRFTIPVPSILVNSPSFGDSWLIGSEKMITWESFGVQNVRIQYSLNNGITNTDIVTNYPADSGRFKWVVPNSPTNLFRIKVLDASNNSLFGWSLANNITPLVLNNFRNGELVLVGDTLPIRWQTTGISNINIEYTSNNGINWISVANNLPAASGQYNWIIPNTPSPDCKIRLTNAINAGVTDISNGRFTIRLYQTQTIALNQGWNLISSFIFADKALMDSVFRSIKDDVIILKNGNGQVYWPSFSINSIGNWNVEDGYLIKLSTARNLIIGGQRIAPELYPINLRAGWNMIGYLRNAGMSVVSAVSPLVSSNKLKIVKDGDGNVYWPSMGVNTIGNLMPGKGYQIRMDSSATLTYPSNGVFKGNPDQEYVTVIPEAKHFKVMTKTGISAIVGIRLEQVSQLLKRGDEIGIFTQSGVLAGSTVFDGGNIVLVIWGDDEQTPEIEGFAEGEKLTIKIWENSSQSDVELTSISWVDGEGKFTKDAIFEVESLNSSLGVIPNSYFLEQNFPNPFNPSTVIRFGIPEDDKVEMEVFNLLGEKVATFVNEQLKAGTYSVNFFSGKLTSGIYFYSIKTKSFSQTRKMLLVK